MTTFPIIARTVKNFCCAYGVSKSTVYKLINGGQLRIVKVGMRTLIVEESARVWFAGLAIEKPSAKTHELTPIKSEDSGGRKRSHVDDLRG